MTEIQRMPEEDRPRLTREELADIARRPLYDVFVIGGPMIPLTPVERDALVALAQRTVAAEGGCSVAHAVHIPEQEFHHLMRSRDELEQQLISVQDEAAEIAGREEGHLNKVEQMRMRAEQAERTLAAIHGILDGPVYDATQAIYELRRLLQEG